MKRALVLALVTALGSLVFVSAAQAQLRVGKNLRLDNKASQFRGKDQLGMAGSPSNPQHVVAVECDYLTEQVEASRSLDGGQTWSNATPINPPAANPAFFPSCRVGMHLANQMYQTVAFGTGNNVYTTFRTPQRTVAGAEQGATVFVAKSTDGGLTWETPVVAMRGGTSPSTGPDYELPTLAVDPGAQSGVDRVYVAAREISSFGAPGGDVAFVRSIDAGASFQGAACPAGVTGPCPVLVEQPAAEPVADPEAPSEPVVLDDGSIVISWRTLGITAQIKASRSSDQGQTWSVTPALVAGVQNNASNRETNPPQPAPSTGSSYPRLAVDQGPTTNVSDDRVYIVYNQTSEIPPTGPFTGSDHFIPPDSDVYFQRSLDAGGSWSTPKLVNEATPKPGLESPYAPPKSFTQTRHPNIAVAPNGRVDIVWQDRRHWYRGCIHTHQPCVEARLGDTYYSFSGDGGTNFSANRRISDRSHNNDVGYDYRFGVYWAFGPEPVPMGNNELLVGWMDAREGSFDSDTQDHYLARVNHAGPAALPQESIPRDPSNVQLSLGLEQHAYPGGGEGLLTSGFATRNGTRVVIVNENDAPAVLAAGVLARANLSNVLLSPAGGLPANVQAEIVRMNPEGAYVIGDETALSAQVVDDLESLAIPSGEIERLGSNNIAETGEDIAIELDRRTAAQQTANTPAFNAAVIVNPASPDASAVAGLAAARRLPVLFTDPDPTVTTLPTATTDALADLDIDKVLVIGGPQWVNAAIFQSLAADSPERLGGANQFETSAAVVDESIERGLPPNVTYVANGLSPMDGALLGSTVGRITGLLMLASPPLASTAPGIAAGEGITDDIDQLRLLQAAQAGGGGGGGIPTYPGPGGGRTLPFAGCPTGSTNVILGTIGNDVRNGTLAGDRIFVGSGNDVVDGLAGDDCIDLGVGDDRAQGGLGNDLVLGGLGADRIAGSSGNDRLRGNAGNDRVNGGLGNDRLHGFAGRDRVSGSRGRDRINGGSGRDTISGGSSGDRVAGDAGSDRINGNSGNDRLSGNSGNDRIRGSSGRDRIRGGTGRDRIAVRDGQVDRVNCGAGTDRVSADSSDIISGNCEIVSVASASAATAAGSLGLPAAVGGAYLALLGWRRRRSRATNL